MCGTLNERLTTEYDGLYKGRYVKCVSESRVILCSHVLQSVTNTCFDEDFYEKFQSNLVINTYG